METKTDQITIELAVTNEFTREEQLQLINEGMLFVAKNMAADGIIPEIDSLQWTHLHYEHVPEDMVEAEHHYHTLEVTGPEHIFDRFRGVSLLSMSLDDFEFFIS